MFELTDAIADVPLAFVDVETTGLSPRRGHRVCEIAILRTLGPEVEDGYQQLVNPNRPMDPGAQAVHGITDRMLRDAPTFDAIAEQVATMLSGVVLVGHNAPFDVGFLLSEFAQAGRSVPDIVALDTLRLAREIYEAPSYKLTNLAASLGVRVDGRSHRAMVDVLLTRGVFQCLVDELRSEGVRTLRELLMIQGGALATPAVAGADVPPEIQRALIEDRLLWISYRSEAGAETRRFVRPLGLHENAGQVCLTAYCFLRDAVRSFRLDRIIEIELAEMAPE